MRALKRWLRRKHGELRLGKRREEIRKLLEADLNRPCNLSPAGACGRDSIYRVSDAGHGFACLRVVNPYLVGARLEADMPFRVLNSTERLEREWSCYSRGAENGLTPKPLWRTDDTLCCEYVHGVRVMDKLLQQPARFWALLCSATIAVSKLHEVGITHMDVSLSNLIATPSDDLVFVDFEYAPAHGLSLAQQRAYDHLRLVESCIKFMPAGLAGQSGLWLETLDKSTDARTRTCDLAPLAPALGRLFGQDGIKPSLALIFGGPGAHSRSIDHAPSADAASAGSEGGGLA